MAASGYCKLLLLLPTKIGFQGKKTMLIGKIGICSDRSSRPEVFLVIGVLKICRRTPMLKCYFNKVAKQLY